MGNTHKNTEKRKSKRLKAEFIVTYKIDKPVEVHMWISDREVDALMLDLSESGMAILTNYDIPASTTLVIKFTLINLYADKDERVTSIKILGEVRYNVLSKESEYRLGISFTQIANEDKHAIAKFIKMAMSR